MPESIKKEDHESYTPLADTGDFGDALANFFHTAQSPELIPSLGDNLGECDFEPFPFKRLPVEIRNMVYSELVVHPQTIKIYGVRIWPRGSHRPVIATRCLQERMRFNGESRTREPSSFQIFRNVSLTSRDIYRELAPIYFAYNTFEFRDIDCVPDFLGNLSPNSRRAISTIKLWYVGKAPAAAFKVLQTCVGLRHLHIVLLEAKTRLLMPHSYLCVMKLHGLGHCLKLRGLTHVDVSLEDDDCECYDVYYADLPEFREALQILKQPHSPVRLARLDKKDYPNKLHRSIFGKANVHTRMENKVMGTTPQCG